MSNIYAEDVEVEEEVPHLEALKEGHFNSDVGYSDAFVEHYGGKIRFIAEEKSWLVFDELRGWHRDRSGEIESFFSDFARELYAKAVDEAKSMEPSEGVRRLKATAHLGDKRKIAPALQLAQSNRKIVVSVIELDQDPYLLGTLNGVVDLSDGSFRPHSQETMVTRTCSCIFDPQADCPTFLRFLHEVQPNKEMRDYIQRLFGYVLTGGVGEHILPFHYGVGANGKGTFLEQAVFRLMGSYACKLTDSLIYVSRHGVSPSLEIAGLSGIRFALGEENEDEGKLNEGALKRLTGGDKQKGRFHYQDFMEFTPTAKVHLVGNHRPRITGRDDGIWRRFRLIEWGVKIAEERRDMKLDQKLLPELSGILNWMIQGSLALRDQGTRPPQCVLLATDKFREDSDYFGEFIKEKTISDDNATITKAELFELYKEYSNDQGTPERFRLSKRIVGKQLIDRGFGEGRMNGDHIWKGLRKREATDEG